MGGFAEIERRIDLLCARAASAQADETLIEDMEDALDHGYLHALKADARLRRIRERLNELSTDARAPSAAGEVWRLTAERRQLEESTRRLRERLASLRALIARSAAARARSR